MNAAGKIDRRARQLECDYCGAEPGEPCVTNGNKEAKWTHVWRWDDARDQLKRERNELRNLH